MPAAADHGRAAAAGLMKERKWRNKQRRCRGKGGARGGKRETEGHLSQTGGAVMLAARPAPRCTDLASAGCSSAPTPALLDVSIQLAVTLIERERECSKSARIRAAIVWISMEHHGGTISISSVAIAATTAAASTVFTDYFTVAPNVPPGICSVPPDSTL